MGKENTVASLSQEKAHQGGKDAGNIGQGPGIIELSCIWGRAERLQPQNKRVVFETVWFEAISITIYISFGKRKLPAEERGKMPKQKSVVQSG